MIIPHFFRKLFFTTTTCVAVLFVACSESDENITRSTADGQFSLTMEAKQNWVRYGDSLPVFVRLTSLNGELSDTQEFDIEFLPTNGSVSPSNLSFTFTGTSDSTATVFETEQSAWIEFESESASRASSTQAEIHALFQNLQTTFKIRLVGGTE